ncbi:carotenoid oxygenase family protein [Persicimonas caeni]|uniref:Carotenoid oxygenase family protein n=1 Tax=Persicimonas caeni TaxID=2292766 RepID=A0A4Y6PU13_PERCE|nr:carotenoid oxygenase family protein [Persicimonas caeni]QDG51609.1 carotenoid oxygenase family protein [Persicimonas caeni]QED32830.1 carotenoid oxygenase family protein [Persicimonas caeni]
MTSPTPTHASSTRASHAVGFRSLHRETHIDALPVDGEVPEWLSGRLVRNGPARFEVEDRSYRHWFDGLAMLHAFGIEGGKVSYANRFLHSDAFVRAGQEGRIALSEFATDPCRSIFGRIMSMFSPDLTDNASVNVTRLADRYVAMTETPMPIEFDPDTLRTLGHIDYAGGVEADATTAHPHYERDSGRELNYALRFGRTSKYKIVATDPKSLERELVGSLEVDRPAYMHSFGMTENYVVLSEWPLVVNPLEMLASNKPFIENYRWKPERGTRFRVFRKHDGALVGDYHAEPRFGFHHVNAFEDNKHLVVDVITYPDATIIDELYLDRVRHSAPANPAGKLERFRLYDGNPRAESRLVSQEPIELPRINLGRSATRAYGCVWGIGVSEPGRFIDQIVRIDLPSGEATRWREEGCYPGEPVFVERPQAEAEDDGVLLSVVLDARRERSFLLVLDAHTLQERARAQVPHHIPFGFHGQFYGESPTNG